MNLGPDLSKGRRILTFPWKKEAWLGPSHLGMDLFHHCRLTDVAHMYCHLEASPECGGMEQ